MEQEKEIYTFRTNFTNAEVKELIDWFEERLDRLPASLQINKSSKTDNLRFTVTKLIAMLKGRDVSVTLSGYIAHLELIKKRLEMTGME